MAFKFGKGTGQFHSCGASSDDDKVHQAIALFKVIGQNGSLQVLDNKATHIYRFRDGLHRHGILLDIGIAVEVGL